MEKGVSSTDGVHLPAITALAAVFTSGFPVSGFPVSGFSVSGFQVSGFPVGGGDGGGGRDWPVGGFGDPLMAPAGGGGGCAPGGGGGRPSGGPSARRRRAKKPSRSALTASASPKISTAIATCAFTSASCD